MSPTTGFKSLADPEDRTCIEEDSCHDISEYQRVTEGEAYPYEHCICHGEIPDPSILVEIKGPRTLAPGAKATYTGKILGGPGVTYGFGINVTNGTLSKNYHFSPLETNEFEFEFTAPAEAQTVYLTVAGLSSDGDTEAIPHTNLTAGDEWNSFRITIKIAHTGDDGSSNEPSTILYLTTGLVMIVIVIIILIILKRTQRKRIKDKK